MIANRAHPAAFHARYASPDTRYELKGGNRGPAPFFRGVGLLNDSHNRRKLIYCFRRPSLKACINTGINSIVLSLRPASFNFLSECSSV